MIAATRVEQRWRPAAQGSVWPPTFLAEVDNQPARAFWKKNEEPHGGRIDLGPDVFTSISSLHGPPPPPHPMRRKATPDDGYARNGLGAPTVIRPPVDIGVLANKPWAGTTIAGGPRRPSIGNARLSPATTDAYPG